MTRALDDVAHPVLYCDKSEQAQKVLKCLMSRGQLPKAPIVDDVKHVSLKHANIVVGGFPCQGFSRLGVRQGFKDARSRTFYDLLRVVDDCRPALVFMENVKPFIEMGLTTVIDQFSRRRGYNLHWCCLPAYSVGAPHKRLRWFCLASRVRLNMTLNFKKHKPFKWRRTLPKLEHSPKPDNKARLVLLGNSLVPDCARLAFIYLFSGGRTLSLNPGKVHFSLPTGGTPSHRRPSPAGCVIEGKWSVLPDVTNRFAVPDLDIKLVPRSLGIAERVKGSRTADLVTRTIALKLWPTPRSAVGGSYSLSVRSRGDLPTAARFYKHTPERLRTAHMTAEWVEWVMGYPTGWTALCAPK